MTTLVQRGSWPGWAAGTADIYLSDAAAAAYLSAKAAYQAATGRTDAQIAEPVGGIRTPAIDAAMLAAFRSRNATQMRYWNLDPASKAPPGLNSPHNNGLCADIWAGTASSWNNGTNWWIVNGPRFGLHRTLVGSGDIHHFQFFPGTATSALNVTFLDGASPTPDPKPRRRSTMTSLFINSSTFDGTGSRTKDSIFALAGDSPGTIANWQEQASGDKFGRPDDPYTIAGACLVPIFGLNSAQFASLKAAYLSPVTVTAPASEATGQPSSAVLEALNAQNKLLEEINAGLGAPLTTTRTQS